MAASSVALTLRKATTITTASAILNKFLGPKTPFTATIPRPFSSSTTTSTPSDSSDSEINHKAPGCSDHPFIVKGSPQKFKMENPFQSGGPKDVVSVDELKDGILVRITLPGIGEDGFKVWVEDNTVFFAGKGEIELEEEKSGRTYGGSLEFNPEFNKVDEVKAEMKNGILRMIIPNVKKS